MTHLLDLLITNPFWWLASHLMTVVGFALCVFLLARVFREHRPAPVTLAWVLAIILIPYIGVPLYFFFGGRKLRGVSREKTLYPRPPRTAHAMSSTGATERVLTSTGMPPARGGNAIQFLGDGQQAYRHLVELVAKAQQSIHLATFILGRDETGRAIIDLLAKKAAEGVKVRLLLDALGCFRTSGEFVEPIRRAGGEVGVFMPVLPLRRKWSANLRNHRKVLVVDDDTAVVGGMNLATEYLGPEADPTRWLDTGAVIAGPAARDLGKVFANDWNFVTEGRLDAEDVAEEAAADSGASRDGKDELAQIAASGPDSPYDAIYEAVLCAMMEARERIWIVTPYFIPDETLYKVLAMQSRLGTDVRIIVPAKSNHVLADLARGRFLRDLAREGAKIHACPRMVHAKLMLFDHRLAVVGSANLDARSLYLNFEVAAMMYSTPTIETIGRWMQQRIAEAHVPSTAPVSLVRGMAENMAGLVAPLL